MAVGTAVALGLAGAQLLGSVLGKKPKAPTLPTLPPPPPVDTSASDAAAAESAGAAQRKRASAPGAGRAGTILTGPRGLTTPAPTQRKTLLGY
jgi:hypothetical protein